MWTFTHPDRPGSYVANIGGTSGSGNIVRRRKKAAHNNKITQWDRFSALETAYKDAIEEAYNQAYLAEMLALTTLEKYKKWQRFNKRVPVPPSKPIFLLLSRFDWVMKMAKMECHAPDKKGVVQSRCL